MLTEVRRKPDPDTRDAGRDFGDFCLPVRAAGPSTPLRAGACRLPTPCFVHLSWRVTTRRRGGCLAVRVGILSNRPLTEHGRGQCRTLNGSGRTTPMSTRYRTLLAWAGCGCVAVSMLQTIAAQSPATDPPASPAPAARHAVPTPTKTAILTVSLSGTSEDEQRADSGSNPQAPAADLETTLAYRSRGKRTTTGLEGRSVFRRTDQTVMSRRQEAKFDLAATGQRQEFRAAQSAAYSPFYEFGTLSAPGVSSDLDEAHSHGDLANASLSALALQSDVEWGW